MVHGKNRWKLICCLITIAAFVTPLAYAQGTKDWLALPNHNIQLESTGWNFPVEIMFVPRPTSNPKDPLYYVTELRGTIKVVTNDRTVMTYAEGVNRYQPPTELPNELAEVGLAGLCLDPVHGYLFATTAYFKKGTFYNKIVRFEHEGGGFATRPSASFEITRIFDQDESTNSHQIGKCRIGKDGKLYVGVGDGHAAHKAQSLQSPNGKILRMNLDGTAPNDNPFYNPQEPEAISGYIYASGMRNPFAIALDETDHLYVADNGPNRDRLSEVVPGKNYLWDGTNESMRGDSLWNWSGSVGPAGVIYLGNQTIFGAWKENVIVAQGGSIQAPGPSEKGRVTLVRYPVKAGQGLQGKPELLVSYQGHYLQLLVPIAEGPDGLYFSGFFPDPEGNTSIFKLVRQPGAGGEMAFVSGSQLYDEKGCDGCHKLKGEGGQAGPALDGLVDRLEVRLNTPEFLQQLAQADALTTEPQIKFREARAQLRQLQGLARVEAWIQYRLQEPRFDREHSGMPNLQLMPDEVKSLKAYLMTLKTEQQPKLLPGEEWHRRFKVWWDSDYTAKPTVAFLVGMFVMALLHAGWQRFRQKKRT